MELTLSTPQCLFTGLSDALSLLSTLSINVSVEGLTEDNTPILKVSVRATPNRDKDMDNPAIKMACKEYPHTSNPINLTFNNSAPAALDSVILNAILTALGAPLNKERQAIEEAGKRQASAQKAIEASNFAAAQEKIRELKTHEEAKAPIVKVKPTKKTKEKEPPKIGAHALSNISLF